MTQPATTCPSKATLCLLLVAALLLLLSFGDWISTSPATLNSVAPSNENAAPTESATNEPSLESSSLASTVRPESRVESAFTRHASRWMRNDTWMTMPARFCPAIESQNPSESSSRYPRYVTFDQVPSRFGLTNQLISVIQAAHIALHAGRALIVPASQVDPPSLERLLNLTRTAELIGCGMRLLGSDCLERAPPEERHRKMPRLHLPSRLQVTHEPLAARSAIRLLLRKMGPSRGVRLSTVMWHVPFTSADLPWTEQWYFGSLAFSDVVAQLAQQIEEQIGEPYATLHLRLEGDSVGITSSLGAFVLPTAEKVASWASACALRLSGARGNNFQRVKTLYVTSGKVDASFLASIRRALPSMRVITKEDLRLPELSREYKAERESVVVGQAVTNHYLAAADLLVAERGVGPVISADYSTFSKAILFRRCSRMLRTKARIDSSNLVALYTYDRHFETLTERRCVPLWNGDGSTLSKFSIVPSMPFANEIDYAHSKLTMCSSE